MSVDRQFSVIDLFAGAGGFGLGFQLAGFRLRLSLEIDAWAVDTLRVNKPRTKIVHGDIRHYQTPETIQTVCKFSPTVIIGGPPCQGFSIAGPQKDPQDPRNSLFRNFACWVEYLKPRIFVMENVKGLLSRQNSAGESVMEIIQQTFSDLGYSVEVWLLNAAEYGVPQIRERVFIVGNRIGITTIGEPPPTHYISRADNHAIRAGDGQLERSISLWDAISDLPKLDAGFGEEQQPYTRLPRTAFQRWARGDQTTLFNHVTMNHTPRMVDRFRHLTWGDSGMDAPAEHQAHRRNGNGEPSDSIYHQNNRRLHPFVPSHTIPAYFYSSFVHPFQHRNLTAREGARIQSFPDEYRFMGKRTVVSRKLLNREQRLDDTHLSQYNQIGNAVPPLLAKAVADQVMRAILGIG